MEMIAERSLALAAMESKYLYICTCEMHKSVFDRWVVHRIEMSDVLSASEDHIRYLPFKQVANEIGGHDLPLLVGCGVFKSKILIGGGVKKIPGAHPSPASPVYFFETDTTDRKLNQKLKLGSFPPFIGGKAQPLLVEMKGQLYALPGDEMKLRYDSHFERFDPSCEKWSPLARPPIWDPDSPYYSTPVGSGYVITDTSILFSRQATPVFRFDITKPNAGWSVQESLCSGKSFPFRGTTLVHDCVYGGFIIFAIDIEPENSNYDGNWPQTRFPRILVYHMSQDYGSWTDVATVELPFTDELPLIFQEPVSYNLVSLGDQRVCLVLATFSSPISSGRWEESEMMHFLVTTFKYKTETTMKGTREESPISFSFSCQFLSNPVIFDYNIQQHTPSPATEHALTLGAFLLWIF
ncbi:uncharacterized protein LOC121050204 [Rosa chinensis]|uniref:uncharacterized protein LOC121050204 n=1 Tax=Rosa chinensis TaxID=74649 RepID=UPI001AD921E2|nr:uncharacterized protein LOC121050204 [Rosa chinensis]